MYCLKCGYQIPAGAAFCPNCGAKVQAAKTEPVQPVSDAAEKAESASPASKAAAQPEPVQSASETAAQPETSPSSGPSVPPVPQPVPDNPQPAGDPLTAIVGKRADYYLAEFKKIDAGQKSRFNWAAFLLGPMMCFYRRSWELFKKYFLPVYIALLVSSLVLMVGMSSLNGPVAVVGIVLALAAGIWGWVNAVRFGRNFNRDYYTHCKQQLAKPVSERKSGTSIKNIVLFLLALTGVEIVLSVVVGLLAMLMLSATLNSAWEDDTYYNEDAYIASSSYYDEEASNAGASLHDSAPVYEPGSSEILRARWNEFLDSSGENEILYLEADNDCDGLFEAFAVTAGEYDDYMGSYFDAKIYFINSNGKMTSVCDTAPDDSPLYGYPTETILSPDDGDGFFIWNLATGTSNYSLVWGVKDGRVYETNISGQYCDVSLADGWGFAAYQLDYSQGYRDYVTYRLNYDSNMHAFTAVADDTAYLADSESAVEDYSTMAYDPTGIYQIIGNDGYVASICLWMDPADVENPFYCDIRSWNGEGGIGCDYYGPARVPADLQSITCGDFIFGIDEEGVPFFNDPMIEVPYGIYYYSESTFSEMQINALVDAAAYAGMDIPTDLLTAYVGDAGLDPSMIYELT